MRRLRETYKEQILFHQNAVENIAEKMLKIAVSDEDRMDVFRITKPHKSFLIANRDESYFVEVVTMSLMENGERYTEINFDELISAAQELTEIYYGESESFNQHYSEALALFVKEGIYSFTIDW